MDLARIEDLPGGARFYRCAFQVNSYDYIVRHNKPTPYVDEDAYNAAIVKACKDQRIEVIGLADHFRIRSAARLIAAAKASGIVAFPGFEVVTKDGVHFLCLFDPATPLDTVQARIHACGIHDDSEISPLGELSAHDLLDKAPAWGAQVIAAHVASAGGIFKALQGQARSAVWRHPGLRACSLPGPAVDAPEEVRPVLENKNPDYTREHRMAVLNCQDVCGPDDLAARGTWSFVKMSEPTIEGLRQAFLDPGSRVRLVSDPAPEEHIEFLGMWWQTEGFLRGARVRFNENMNVLIGGRGAGKSTVIESLRYVLGIEPIGAEAKRIHDGIVRDVLCSGTKISLLVQSYRPDRRLFLIERTVPNPPRVTDESGSVLAAKPLDIVRGASVFGQNELAEVARSPDRLTALLQRFVPANAELDTRAREIGEALARNRRDILELEEKIRGHRDALAALPGLRETAKRYAEAGVEGKLREQAQIVKAEAVISAARQALQPFAESAEKLAALMPISDDFLSDDALEGLPVHDKLVGLRETLAALQASAGGALSSLRGAIESAEAGVGAVDDEVASAKATTQASYEATLRELQRAHVDGEEFMRLQRDLARLVPIEGQLDSAEKSLADLQQARRNELARWDDCKRERYQRLERAAKRVSRELPNRLRVMVAFGRNSEQLATLLKQELSGRLAETIEVLASPEKDLSVSALAEACRGGSAELYLKFSIPQAQAERIAKAGSKLALLIEELELTHVTEVELNVGPENAPPEWRRLSRLSTGQKATALLYLLLLDADGPLVLDQPEDNLDNRFISEGVVPKIRAEKRRRQFIFSTHNANIPVLGDAEQIIAMRAVGESGDGHAEMPSEHVGAIDRPAVAALVEEILEGGKEAFQQRRRKYGF